jgi:DNA-3-methyladenine glycosylase I
VSGRCFEGPELGPYHDEEWGRPVTDERGLYERICLEGFQAGLSWLTVLRKREPLREAFAGFDPDAVAAFGAAELEALAADPRLIRSPAKLRAAVGNARATIALRATPTSLPSLVWSHRPPAAPAPAGWADVPARTEASAALAGALKAAGFAFVGPITAYALMQACGLVDDHLAACPWRAGVEAQRAAARLPAPAPPDPPG